MRIAICLFIASAEEAVSGQGSLSAMALKKKMSSGLQCTFCGLCVCVCTLSEQKHTRARTHIYSNKIV